MWCITSIFNAANCRDQDAYKTVTEALCYSYINPCKTNHCTNRQQLNWPDTIIQVQTDQIWLLAGKSLLLWGKGSGSRAGMKLLVRWGTLIILHLSINAIFVQNFSEKKFKNAYFCTINYNWQNDKYKECKLHFSKQKQFWFFLKPSKGCCLVEG
jgi:hypothetical protein